MKRRIKPVDNKPDIFAHYWGAVASIFNARVEAAKKNIAQPEGLLTQMAIIRLHYYHELVQTP